MEKPLISVIVPVYNVEKYLERCVNSIINQTYQNLEIILVDDGSTDNSGKTCDEYAKRDNRIKVIHKENGGQSAARNDGINVATGEYIGFVDSDDWIEPQAYELLHSMISSDKFDIAICGYRKVHDEAVTTSSNQCGSEIFDNDTLWNEVLGYLNNAVWNKLFKAELLEDIRFSTDIHHGEDLIFDLEYIKKCKKGILNRTPIYNYFKHQGSITGSAFSERRFMEITSKDAVLEIVKKENPKFIKTAEKYCFRARMNVLRSIYKSNLQNTYTDDVKIIRDYIFSNYKNIAKFLKFKEKIEFKLYKHFLLIYYFFTKVL